MERKIKRRFLHYFLLLLLTVFFGLFSRAGRFATVRALWALTPDPRMGG